MDAGAKSEAGRADPDFHALHRRFAPMVHDILIAAVPPQDAEDLTQEVFLAAWRKRGSLRRAESAGPWLATIARNRARRHLARRRPRPEPLPEGLAAGAGDGGAGGGDRLVLDALQGLPEGYREALAMRLVEGMTGPEIAAATGRTPGSVRVQLTRGRRLLRDALERLRKARGIA